MLKRSALQPDFVAFTAMHKNENGKIMSVVAAPAEEGTKAMNIATISAGFEKGDFLVREEQGNRVYFDFFEEVRNVTLDGMVPASKRRRAFLQCCIAVD
jgi:hypothetical protein